MNQLETEDKVKLALAGIGFAALIIGTVYFVSFASLALGQVTYIVR